MEKARRLPCTDNGRARMVFRHPSTVCERKHVMSILSRQKESTKNPACAHRKRIFNTTMQYTGVKSSGFRETAGAASPLMDGVGRRFGTVGRREIRAWAGEGRGPAPSVFPPAGGAPRQPDGGPSRRGNPRLFHWKQWFSLYRTRRGDSRAGSASSGSRRAHRSEHPPAPAHGPEILFLL